MFWFLGSKACGILATWPGVEPTPPEWEGELLTTGPLGRSLCFFSNISESLTHANHTQDPHLGSQGPPNPVVLMYPALVPVTSSRTPASVRPLFFWLTGIQYQFAPGLQGWLAPSVFDALKSHTSEWMLQAESRKSRDSPCFVLHLYNLGSQFLSHFYSGSFYSI